VTTTIRRTTDLETVRRLDAELIGTDVAPPSADHTWWLCMVDGKVAGYCGMSVFKDEKGLCAFLSRSGVLREFRGRGLQKRMIRVREAEARRRCCVYALTYTARSNLASANNLIRCGYSLYEAAYPWGVKGALYFTKRV
jgi:GNAT superfamily N-acetyltransferase